MLRDVSQNFPLQARALVRTTVSADVRREIQRNQKVCLKSGWSAVRLLCPNNARQTETLLHMRGEH